MLFRSGTGNYKGAITKQQYVKIISATLNEEKIQLVFPGEPLENPTYNGVEADGTGKEPTVVSEDLVENTDYTIERSYTKYNEENGNYEPFDGIPTEIGTYRMSIVVRGINNYKGAVSGYKYVRIQSPQIYSSDVTIRLPENLEYTDNAVTAEVEIAEGKSAEVVEITYTGDNVTDGKAINAEIGRAHV